jgi:hypothetical protein
MNAITQILAEIKLKNQQANADRCTVEEVTETLAVETPVVAEPPVTETPVAVGKNANTMMVFANNSAELMILRDVFHQTGGESVQIPPRTENVSEQLVKAILAGNAAANSQKFERLVTDFGTLTIEALTDVLNKTEVSLVFFNRNESDNQVIPIILNKLKSQYTGDAWDSRVVVEYYTTNITEAYCKYFDFVELFKTPEVYSAWQTSAEFREKLFLIYICEITFHKSSRNWLDSRLFNLTSVEQNQEVYVGYRLSQVLRYRNMNSRVLDNLIVSDYHYNDGPDYTAHLRQMTDSEEKRVNENVEFFLLLARSYVASSDSKRVTVVRLISYNPTHNVEISKKLSTLLQNVAQTDVGGGIVQFEGFTNVSQDEIVDHAVRICEPFVKAPTTQSPVVDSITV